MEKAVTLQRPGRCVTCAGQATGGRLSEADRPRDKSRSVAGL